MALVKIDPVPRIEGHLRVTVEVDGGKVKDAWCTSTMFRGFNIFSKGRDPRDIWHIGSRICGVCPTPHAINGVQAAERAMGVDKVPDNARLVRNMLEATQLAYDHVLWFYHLNGLDYVNIVNALKAKPTDPELKNLAATLTAFVESGQLGPFANHWWDHPAYKLPPELDLTVVKHYLDALKMQQRVNEAAAIIGGKFPMIMSLAPGGVTHLPSIPQILDYRERLMEAKRFIDGVMVPDLLAIAPFYAADLAATGGGHKNYLTWGVLDEKSQDPYDRLYPRGAIYDGQLKVAKVDPKDVKIYANHSWAGDAVGKAPLDAGQEPIDAPSKLPETAADLGGKYGWTQAARIGDKPMEVGPLAAVLVAYVSGRKGVKTLVDTVLAAVGQAGNPGVLMSNLGRLAGRVIHAKDSADNAIRWSDELIANIKAGDTTYFIDKPIPDSGEGVGGWDAPRGALCHWIRIEGGKVSSYAPIPASNWNLSPRDDKGVRGPVEEALIGTPVAIPDKPLEVLRTVHTFDP